MASIINADTSDGLKITSDTSGQIDLQSAGSTKATIDTSGNLKFDSGYGSVATAYGCRAWVNFNGTGTVAIRASANVSSITDGGIGRYTVNFTTAMPDANYSTTASAGRNGTGAGGYTVLVSDASAQTASATNVGVVISTFSYSDSNNVFCAVFR